MTLRAGWLLWADWCRATGRTSLAVTEEALAEFAAQVDGDHRSDLRATVRETGMPWPVPEEPHDPWAAAEAGMLDLEETLRRCGRWGWPASYAGRRDAWLLVLTRGLRLTRRATLAVGPLDVAADASQVLDRPVSRGRDAATCPRCVIARWWRCVEREHQWGRSAVREMLAVPALQEGHDCDGLQEDGLPPLPGHVVLSPAIDQHGWAGGYRPMSPRAVTAVLAARSAPGPVAVEEPGPLTRPVREPGPVGEVDPARLEAACAAADEVNRRVEALLDDTDAALADIRRRRR